MITTQKPKPVLMIPLRRCGSHAFRLRLNASPDFYSPYPLHIVDFMPLVPLYGDLTDDKYYFRLVVDVIGLQAAGVVKWDVPAFDPVKIFNSIKNEARSVHRVVWALLLEAGVANHAKVVMDKSLDSVHYAEELMGLFSNMLFINVVRDPRAQVASMNKAIIHDFDSGLNACTWLEAHSKAKTLAAKYPERILTIRFEDFVANDEVVLKKVCDFIGIQFLPTMLDISQSSEAKDISKISALWESNLSAPITANVDKFKKSLTTEDIKIIESITGDLMDFYGYQKLSTGYSTYKKEFFSQISNQQKKERAWQMLEESNHIDFSLRKFRVDYLQNTKSKFESLNKVRKA